MWDGDSWLHRTLAEASIQPAGAYLTNINSEILSEISDVAAYSSIASGEILEWSGSAWVHQTLAEAGIQPAGSYLTDITGESLEDLGDVDAYSSLTADEVLVWSGTGWAHQTLAEAGIQAAGQVADLTINAKAGAYTLILTDDVVTGDSSGGTFTLTLPTAVGNDGKLFHIKKIDSSANAVTIDGATTETIDGAETITLDVQWHSLTIVSDGANWLII